MTAPAATHRIVFGDARQMSDSPDASVHLIITSPPYWQLKDYGTAAQIGFDDSYEAYINNLNLVWLECTRVLHDGCRLCVNVGDQFARSTYYGRYKVIPIRTEIIRFCETVGFDFMGSIVWQKVTTCNTSGGGSVMGSFPCPRNGIVKLDYEHILLFKKHGAPPRVSKQTKEASKLTTEEWNTNYNGHWNFPGEKQNGHLAMFPEELPRRLIRMFSFVGETVLDPFAGSGTTSLAASHLGRNSIGYEINSDFECVISEKVPGVTFATDSVALAADALSRLPYLFVDPLKLDKTTDPRKNTYGSRISNGDTSDAPEYQRVTEVSSGTEIVLESGDRVRLRGVTSINGRENDAREFLTSKVHGKLVLLKREPEATDGAAYVYLKNRTFVNAHMVREGYATVDRTRTTNRTLLKYADEEVETT